MIAIIDYEMGNLRSVQKALEKAGAQTVITDRASDLKEADKIVLPGVGAIRPAMEKLKELKIIPAIKDAIDAGKPFLGICLGLQLLFETSSEGGQVKALGILPGVVKRFTALKVPHMGWNQLHIPEDSACPLWEGFPQDSEVYFCHSYYVEPRNKKIVAARTDYGITFASAVWQDNIFGVQFHPEKSQNAGLEILGNFARL